MEGRRSSNVLAEVSAMPERARTTRGREREPKIADAVEPQAALR